MSTSTDPVAADPQGAPTPRKGPFQRLISSLAQSKADLQASDLQSEAQNLGCTPIGKCTPGEPSTVTGVLRSVTLRPRDGVPAVEADLFDGSGSLLLIWLGRRRIGGIEPGRGIVVHGRITCNLDRPAIFNPRYELRPLVKS